MGNKKCVGDFCEEAHEIYRLEDRGNEKVDSNTNAPHLYREISDSNLIQDTCYPEICCGYHSLFSKLRANASNQARTASLHSIQVMIRRHTVSVSDDAVK